MRETLGKPIGAAVDRRDAVQHLISLDRPLDELAELLRRYPFDCDAPLVVLRPGDVVAVLDRFLAGELAAQQVIDWADLLEVRDDVGLRAGDDLTQDVLFALATPEVGLLGQVLDRTSALELRSRLLA